jgi:antitoxin (DNA-binding transcriptional repressor) of toxin-antitoxin stability system
MPSVNMHEAKTQLSKLVEALKNGSETEITIAKDGVPSAKLVAIEPKPQRRIGIAKGLFEVPKSIDRENEAISRLFDGEND